MSPRAERNTVVGAILVVGLWLLLRRAGGASSTVAIAPPDLPIVQPVNVTYPEFHLKAPGVPSLQFLSRPGAAQLGKLAAPPSLPLIEQIFGSVPLFNLEAPAYSHIGRVGFTAFARRVQAEPGSTLAPNGSRAGASGSQVCVCPQ